MKHKTLILFLSCLFLLLTDQARAQSFKKNKARDPFRSTQAFIGLMAGPNFTQISVEATFSDFSSIDLNEDELLQDEKKYGTYLSQPAYQFGLSAAFSFNRHLSVVSSPAYKQLMYRYESSFAWTDLENPDNYLSYTYTHQQQLSYISLPLIVRYSPFGKKIRPYVQLGAYYDRLLTARKRVSTEGFDKASGSEIAFQSSTQSNDISHLYIRSHTGLLAGAGLSYNMGTLLLFIDTQYRHALHQVTNAQTRFSGSREIFGFGNVLDDISFRNFEISLGCYFPLKFLTKDFSPVIL